MTSVVQWEPDGLRAARMKRCEDILAGKIVSLEYVADIDLHNLQLGDEKMATAITHFSWCELADAAASPLAAAKGMPKLGDLSLRRNQFTDVGAAILAASPMLVRQLTRIDLDYNDEMTRVGSGTLLASFGDALVR